MPGDRIELLTTKTEPLGFAAVSTDGSVYVAPTLVEPGRERPDPGAIRLDAALGGGRHRVLRRAVRAFEQLEHAPPPGCTTDRFTLVKVPR